MANYAGNWISTFGPMALTQEGNRVRGHYQSGGHQCLIDGEDVRGRLVFRYEEPTVQGEGWFDLIRGGNAFAGHWHPDGAQGWAEWTGERVGWDGLWESDFGLLRLVREGDQVRGFYEATGGSTIEGRVEGERMIFSYQEPTVRGEGQFRLAPDGLAFQGQWRPEGRAGWLPWRGARVLPRPGLTWLVVVEAPWQRFLSDREYAFGHMLREFFARLGHVQVRHRFFVNEASLRKCCRDLMYLAEPVVLVLASHGLPQGVTVDGHTVAVAAVMESLRHATDLRLVHFSACLVMEDPAVVESLRALSRQARLPLSGYATSVDWAASAIIEFTYLEMILAKGMTPAAAAEQVYRLLPFAGEQEVPGGAYAPAGFRLILPGDGGEAVALGPPVQAQPPVT
jgi:hypothetical protein